MRRSFEAFLSQVISDCVNANHEPTPERWQNFVSEPIGPEYTQEQMEADAQALAARCMEKRDVLTPDEASAYSAGISNDEPEDR